MQKKTVGAREEQRYPETPDPFPVARKGGLLSDATPLENQWMILRNLMVRRYGMTVSEMADETGCSTKTVRRYLEHFEYIGIPLQVEIGPRGLKTYKLDGKCTIPLDINYEQAFALYLGRKLLEPLAGTPFWEWAQDAYEHIRVSLDRHSTGYLKEMASTFYQTTIGVSNYADKEEIVNDLQRAIKEHLMVPIAYQSPKSTEPVTRTVYPYGFVYHRGSLYLVAFAEEHREIRHYKVDRITEADVGKNPVTFDPPDEFSLEEHLAGAFGVFHGDGDIEVEVLFSPSVATYISEKTWHLSQTLDRQPDGSILLKLRLGTTEEVKHWIFSFGSRALVLNPASLRAEIATELREAAERYEVKLDDSIQAPKRRHSARPQKGDAK